LQQVSVFLHGPQDKREQLKTKILTVLNVVTCNQVEGVE